MRCLPHSSMSARLKAGWRWSGKVGVRTRGGGKWLGKIGMLAASDRAARGYETGRLLQKFERCSLAGARPAAKEESAPSKRRRRCRLEVRRRETRKRVGNRDHPAPKGHWLAGSGRYQAVFGVCQWQARSRRPNTGGRALGSGPRRRKYIVEAGGRNRGQPGRTGTERQGPSPRALGGEGTATTRGQEELVWWWRCWDSSAPEPRSEPRSARPLPRLRRPRVRINPHGTRRNPPPAWCVAANPLPCPAPAAY